MEGGSSKAEGYRFVLDSGTCKTPLSAPLGLPFPLIGIGLRTGLEIGCTEVEYLVLKSGLS